MNKIIFPLGILSGLVLLSAVIGPALILEDAQTGAENLGYGIMLLASAGAVVAMILISRKYPETKFGQLVKAGVLTAAIGVGIFFIGNIVFYTIVEPDYLVKANEKFVVENLAKISDETQKAAYSERMENQKATYTNPFIYSGIMSVTMFMICLMPVAVCGYALFRIGNLRKNKSKK